MKTREMTYHCSLQDTFWMLSYYFIEHLDGERKALRVISYPRAQRMKWWILGRLSR